MAMNLAYILPRVCFFFVILNVSYFLFIMFRLCDRTFKVSKCKDICKVFNFKKVYLFFSFFLISINSINHCKGLLIFFILINSLIA